MNRFVPPTYAYPAFDCPYCRTRAQQTWIKANNYITVSTYLSGKELKLNNTGLPTLGYDLAISRCQVCGEIIIWYKGNIIYPDTSTVPAPNEMMPEKVKEIYMEAASIFNKSAKSAAALLRLALQILLKEIGGSGKNINEDIGSLLSKGVINKDVQEVCDVLRVIGNNSVHPGQIDIDDTPGITKSLFDILNFIVKETIEDPAKRKEMFENLPKSAKDAIAKRDGT